MTLNTQGHIEFQFLLMDSFITMRYLCHNRSNIGIMNVVMTIIIVRDTR